MATFKPHAASESRYIVMREECIDSRSEVTKRIRHLEDMLFGWVIRRRSTTMNVSWWWYHNIYPCTSKPEATLDAWMSWCVENIGGKHPILLIERQYYTVACDAKQSEDRVASSNLDGVMTTGSCCRFMYESSSQSKRFQTCLCSISLSMAVKSNEALFATEIMLEKCDAFARDDWQSLVKIVWCEQSRFFGGARDGTFGNASERVSLSLRRSLTSLLAHR
jgi:hypothetical protein